MSEGVTKKDGSTETTKLMKTEGQEIRRVDQIIMWPILTESRSKCILAVYLAKPTLYVNVQLLGNDYTNYCGILNCSPLLEMQEQMCFPHHFNTSKWLKVTRSDVLYHTWYLYMDYGIIGGRNCSGIKYSSHEWMIKIYYSHTLQCINLTSTKYRLWRVYTSCC